MRSAALESGQDHLDGVAPFFLLRSAWARTHQADVVGICRTDFADTGENIPCDIAVAAAGSASEVVLDSGEPRFGRVSAVLREVSRNEGDVVRMLAWADADLSLERGIGELFICEGLEVRVFVGVEHTGAQRQRVPVAVRVAEVGGHRGVQRFGFDRLGHAFVDEVDQISDVDGHQNIGGRICALRSDALRQALLYKHGIDRDTGLGGESFEQRRNQSRFARGVDVDIGQCSRRQQDANAERKPGVLQNVHSGISINRDGSRTVRRREELRDRGKKSSNYKGLEHI